MILCLGIYLYANNLRYQLIPSKNIIYNRILQSDWTKGTTGYTQLKAVSDATFPWWSSPWKKSKILIYSLQRCYWSQNPDWTRGPTGHTQPKVVLLDTTFPWWLSPLKKSTILIDSFQRYWVSKNTVIWLDERHNWSHPIKKGSLRCYLSLMFSSMQKISRIDWFSAETLTIKVYCNLISWEHLRS